MTEGHEFFSQVGDDPLSATIKPGGNALHKRRDLRDFHYCTCAPALRGEPPVPAKVPPSCCLGLLDGDGAQKWSILTGLTDKLARRWRCPHDRSGWVYRTWIGQVALSPFDRWC